MKLVKVFRIFTKLNLGVGHVTAFMIMAMMLLTAVNVVLRYIFKSPLDWPLEICEYMVVACAFLPACYTLLEKNHIAVDFVYMRFSPRRRLWMDIFTSVMGLVYSVVLTWQSGMLALRCCQRNWLSETGTDIPLFPSYAVVPIGAFLLCLGFLAIFVERVFRLKGQNLDEDT